MLDILPDDDCCCCCCSGCRGGGAGAGGDCACWWIMKGGRGGVDVPDVLGAWAALEVVENRACSGGSRGKATAGLLAVHACGFHLYH